MTKTIILVCFTALLSLASLVCCEVPSAPRKLSICSRHANQHTACLRLRGGAGIKLKTVTCPDKALALTNKIYLHESDLRRVLPEGEGYVTTRGCIFLASTCNNLPACSVALNSCQRRSLQVSCDEDLELEKTQIPTSTLHVSSLLPKIDLSWHVRTDVALLDVECMHLSIMISLLTHGGHYSLVRRCMIYVTGYACVDVISICLCVRLDVNPSLCMSMCVCVSMY